MARLLVLIPDRISDILQKGEYQPRYYNPGEVFDEVHIVSTTPDVPDISQLQRTVGNARLYTHFYPDNTLLEKRRPRFLQRALLRNWARGGIELARSIKPDLIRCHGADWNSYLASRIKAATGVPYLVSLHINPDINPTRRSIKKELNREEISRNQLYEYIEREGLRHADLVMPVYEPILPYLERHGVTRVKVCYNVLDGSNLRRKTNYALGRPPRIISVGRLLNEKDPTPIINAVAKTPGVELLIVGDGPKRAELEAAVSALSMGGRIKFAPAIANDELCRMLPEYDLFAIHSEYWEINKSVLEALLAGLPCVINRRLGQPVPEFEGGDFVRLVENSEDDYLAAITELLNDDAERAGLGGRAYAHAQEKWAPEKTEAVYAEIYREFLAGRNAA